jgi:hypothetical protein
MFNRWQEDWSVLADPRVPCEAFDELKPNRNQDYLISRNEFHADLRIANQMQVLVQLQSDFAP